MAKRTSRSSNKVRNSGRLRIGNDWNAISIIALSQSNPLKAVAEFVENDDILARLRQMGVDFAQGYGIEAPYILT